MADTLVNTLYPPAVETFQPAFVYTDPAAITFSISPFNAALDIKYVHVSVTDQRNNENVLKGSRAFDDNYGIYNGLLVSKFPQGEEVESGLIYYDQKLDLYSISIPTNLLRKEDTVKVVTETVDENAWDDETGQNIVSSNTRDSQYFNVGQYYKVQLRFDNCDLNLESLEKKKRGEGTDEEAAEAARLLQGYMVDQRPYFSEWSTVTLIKPILPIHVYFPQIPQDSEEIATFNKGLIRVAARVWFADTEENTVKLNEAYGNGRWEEDEHLERYRIRVYQADVSGKPMINTLVTDTKEIYAEPTRVNNTYEYGINYVLDLENTDDKYQYVLVLDLWSNNDYHYTTNRIFAISKFADAYNSLPKWHKRIEADYNTTDMLGYIEVNQEDGVAIIDFSWTGNDIPSGVLYIKRACSKNNFKTWDIISITEQPATEISVHIEDYTICSLYRYRYSAQYEQLGGLWTKIYYSNTIYPKFYEMLLERQNRQIAIRYNGQVTSWKPVVNRQKVDTLGGRYPKFVENAQMNYKQFSVQGLIAAEEDFNRKFLNEFQGQWIYNETSESYEYQYYYQGDMIAYDTEFDGKYIIKNDTIADGEFGYNPDEATNIDGTPSGDQGNKYLDHENSNGHHTIPNEGNTKSIFADLQLDGGQQNTAILRYQHDLYPQDNWYWEREFREQLVQWLNDGEPKLYRSMPEGNVAVILTDVSLTPMTQLGRRLYQFTATMYEVGDGYSLEDLDRLGIINIPKLATAYVEHSSSSSTDDDDSSSTDLNVRIMEQVGQLYLPKIYGNNLVGGTNILEPSTYIWDSTTVTDRINNQHRGALKNLVVDNSSIYLKDLRIQYRSKPHWYAYNGNNSWTYLSEQDMQNVSQNTQVYLGYVLNITYSNGLLTPQTQTIFVNEKGYYQVPSNTFVKEISLDSVAQDEVIIDYIAHYSQSYDSSALPSRKKTVGRIVGQWGGMYPVNTYAGAKIYEKYNITQYRFDENTAVISTPKFVNFMQRLDYWQGISVDVSPYAVIGIKYQEALEYQRIVVGHTGVFSIIDDTPTEDIAFLGRKMFWADQSRQPYLDEWEYTLDDSIKFDPDTGYYPMNWYELQNTQIVDSGNRVEYYFAQQTDNEEDADAEIPIGMENLPFRQWLEIHTSDPVDISHPFVNRVYPIMVNNAVQYYIYYIDYKWYPIALAGDGTALAAVPVYGYINYIGNIVRSEYS